VHPSRRALPREARRCPPKTRLNYVVYQSHNLAVDAVDPQRFFWQAEDDKVQACLPGGFRFHISGFCHLEACLADARIVPKGLVYGVMNDVAEVRVWCKVDERSRRGTSSFLSSKMLSTILQVPSVSRLDNTSNTHLQKVVGSQDWRPAVSIDLNRRVTGRGLYSLDTVRSHGVVDLTAANLVESV
jgi:hypothetical protein